jgi:glutamine---fructose-6-phosphate transaminase (isomerizing)
MPHKIEQVLQADSAGFYEQLARQFFRCSDFLYLGRGIHYPIALEGALKLKEISYIHAEGYPAGEMKHGPNALIDENLPVVVLATRDDNDPASVTLYEKSVSNIKEVKARDGIVISIVTQGDHLAREASDHLIELPPAPELLVPLLEILPLQLLAYHIAVRRGCDVDQPRNLAKSVTVVDSVSAPFGAQVRGKGSRLIRVRPVFDCNEGTMLQFAPNLAERRDASLVL